MAAAHLAAGAQLCDELVPLRQSADELRQLRLERRLFARDCLQLPPQLIRSILRLLQLRLRGGLVMRLIRGDLPTQEAHMHMHARQEGDSVGMAAG